MGLFNKVDEPNLPESLESLADKYKTIPQQKRDEINSQFGGYQNREFYQGMIEYMYGAEEVFASFSYEELRKSSSVMVYAIANGLINEDFGNKKKQSLTSLLDDKMSDEDFNTALKTNIPEEVEDKLNEVYSGNQSISFYNGMLRSAVLVFSTAYQGGDVQKGVLDIFKYNYVYVAKIISKKLKVN